MTDATLSSVGLLVLLAASVLFALWSFPDTRGRLAIDIGLSDEAAATIPSCFCVTPEFDAWNPPQPSGSAPGPRP